MARILLVEDDSNVLLLLEHVLRDDGHDVDLAVTVQQAQSRLRQHRYDLVVADGKLPDGTGMQIGDAANTAGVRVLIVTGFAFHAPERGAAALRLSLETAPPRRIAAGSGAQTGRRFAARRRTAIAR